MNARAVFVKERWATGDMKGISLIDAAKTINEEWNALSAAEKQVSFSCTSRVPMANAELSNLRIPQQQTRPAMPKSIRPSSITRCHHTTSRQQRLDSSVSLQQHPTSFQSRRFGVETARRVLFLAQVCLRKAFGKT
jgi:hypothetical protein